MNHAPRTAMAHAFRETALSLIGLFQVYEVDPDLAEATAEVLRKVFRRHLRHAPESTNGCRRNPMHVLVDEMDRVAEGAGGR